MNNSDVYQKVADAITDSLAKGIVPWHQPWRSLCPQNAHTKKAYRGVNPYLLFNTDFQDPRWLTFNQAKDLGGSVKKGEKGRFIVFWKMLESKTEAKKTIPFLKYSTVFNLEQTEGCRAEPLAELIQRNDGNPIDLAESIVKGMPKKPEVQHGPSARACYTPTRDLVQMPTATQFDSMGLYYRVLFHELAHSTGHFSRLNRFSAENFTDAGYSKEELIAEAAAAMLSAVAQLDVRIEQSAAYMKGWASHIQSDPRAFVTAFSQAQKVSDFITGNLEEKKMFTTDGEGEYAEAA